MNEYVKYQFASIRPLAYLNSAAVSPLPQAAVEAVTWQLGDVSSRGGLGYQGWIDTKNRSRALLAEMLGVRSEQVAFTRNTSDGFATIANGLAWKPGDNIVTFAGEFPANYYAWRRIRDEFGVELRLAPERSGRIDLGELIATIDRNTKVVDISSVHYASGFCADLERIGLCGGNELFFRIPAQTGERPIADPDPLTARTGRRRQADKVEQSVPIHVR